MVVLTLPQINRQTVAIWRQIRAGLTLAIVAMLSQACSNMPFGGFSATTPAEKKAASVKERAQLRWDALIKDDIPAAYAYLSPATRDVLTVEQYKAKTPRGTFKRRPSTRWSAKPNYARSSFASPTTTPE